MKQRAAILLLCVAALFGRWEIGQAQTNAGFVQGLWYDQETLLVNEPVRIYAAIRNNTGGDLTGTVEFYVDGDRIERNNVAALNNRIVESWADWTPRYGTSTIRATLSRTELSSTASGTRRVTVVSALTEDVVFVDRDTDSDGVGNATDTDDDGDGISDHNERERGTDPLDAKDPGETETDSATSPEESAEEDEDDKDEGSTIQENNDEPEGLEQFLAESRGRGALSMVTDTINSTRERLDAYRQLRNSAAIKTPTETSDITVGEEGTTTTLTSETGSSSSSSVAGSFGEIERSVPSSPPPSFWSKVWHTITTGADLGYTFLLWLISLFLWHPVLVQLSLLGLILFIIYKLAKKFGSRGAL